MAVLAIVVLLILEHRLFAVAAAVAFIRTFFKGTEKQFVSIKKKKNLHKLHKRERTAKAFMHKLFNNSIFLISFEHYLKRHKKPINVFRFTRRRREKIFSKR